jgi:hypothetical protein
MAPVMMIFSTVALPLTSCKTGDTVQSVPSEFSRPIFGRFFVSYVWVSV